MNEEVEWIELPVKFKGIWYSPDYGGFEIYLSDRFNPSFPPDRLVEALKKHEDKHPFVNKEHEHASPTWMSKQEFEKEFGKVEKILVNKKAWSSDSLITPDDKHLLIFTKDNVVTMGEYDGYEYFVALPRNWKKLLKRRTRN